MPLPENDAFLRSREEFEDEIVATMGGRAAEEIIFNQFTTGASNDLQQATSQRARDGHAVRHERRARSARLRQRQRIALPRS